MYDRDGKSERILTELGADVPEFFVIEPSNFTTKYHLIVELFIF